MNARELPKREQLLRTAYDSFDSLKELCSYYLAHDNEREEIARHGFETVARLHTYDTRILQMLDMAFPG